MRKLVLSIMMALSISAAQAQLIGPSPGGLTAGSTPVSGCTSLQLFYNNAGALGCMAGTSWTSASSLLALDGKLQVKNGATSVFESNTASFGNGAYLRFINTDFFISFFDTYAHAAASSTSFRGTYIDNVKISTSGHFGLSAVGADAFNPDTFLTRKAAASLQFGRVDAAVPVAQTIGPQSVVAGTSNTAGVDFTVRGSAGTGTGIGGDILLQVAPAGGSGTAQNAQVTALTLDAATGHPIVPSKTVAGLPTCNAAATGALAYVTDQLAACPVLDGTFTGGGAVKCFATCNGTAWVR